jgi:septum formation topological specificity factor MinE
MGRIFYKGKEVNELPVDAISEMSKRLESVVSRYFASHPEEYELYLRSKKEKSAPAVPATRAH